MLVLILRLTNNYWGEEQEAEGDCAMVRVVCDDAIVGLMHNIKFSRMMKRINEIKKRGER